MRINLNRRTFMAALGTAAVVAASIRPGSSRTAGTRPLRPIHFLSEQHAEPPARPKSSAITYLAPQCHCASGFYA